MTKNLLLVEDDETFRSVIKNVVQTMGFTVYEAADGKVAMTMYDRTPDLFELVISDVRMPEVTGIDLLKHIRSDNKDLKFILMTGFSELIEARRAYDIGANEFLPKPFRLENLRKVINACFTDQKAEGDSQERLCRVNLDECVSSSKLLVELFIRMGDGKLVNIAHVGDVIALERLKAHQKKDFDQFYCRQADLRKVVGLNLRQYKGTAAPETKHKFMDLTSDFIRQSKPLQALERKELDQAIQSVENTLNMIAQEAPILALLESLHNDNLYAHSAAVAAYACVIGRAMGHESLADQTRLAMGGLLHDIGKRDLPVTVKTKSRASLTAHERAAFESHPERGREIISQIGGVPEDVIQIIAHHHERDDGTGFPYRLMASRIHPFAKIVARADAFVLGEFIN